MLMRQSLSLWHGISSKVVPSAIPIRHRLISSLKVPWRRDPALDSAIDRDKRPALCYRVVRQVLHRPLPLRYLERRRPRLRLDIRLSTFLRRFPNLLELYPDRLSPSSPPLPFLRPAPPLRALLAHHSALASRLRPLALAKLCKLLLLSSHHTLPLHKLLDVRRLFGFPDDLLSSLVSPHPHLLRHSHGHLHLLSSLPSYAKSHLQLRADHDSHLLGITVRPNFKLNFPTGFNLSKEMRHWTQDWLELPYISPYSDASHLSTASREMEKRNVALLHEFLSLTIQKRAPVASIGKFCSEFRLSNAFSNAFTRHPGIFYVSFKGGIETAMLREAYAPDGTLLDRDPFLELIEGFADLVDEGHREYLKGLKSHKPHSQPDIQMEQP